MGRTKRRRARKRHADVITSFEDDLSIISLKKWMKTKCWKDNNHFRLSYFKDTGRGLMARKQILSKDTLLEIPYELMITYSVLQNSYLNEAILKNPKHSLAIQDALSIYLAFEKHRRARSKWQVYIDSLPKDVPYLPWLCNDKEMQSLPKELRELFLERLRIFEASWTRSRKSINPMWKCECCNSPGHRVLTLNSFTWAYIMVNTRAVYVDPNIVRKLSDPSANSLSDILSDDPCMALCPYLDMFNHSNKAETQAKLVQCNEMSVFKLITLTPFEKYKETCISYGSHGNIKLLNEYGFFIPDDDLEIVTLDFKDILGYAKNNLTERQYKFLRNRHLDIELYVNTNGLSFNLKAALYVVLNPKLLDWCACVFNDHYSTEDLLLINQIAKQLVQLKTDTFSEEFTKLREVSETFTEKLGLISAYMQYKLTFMERIINKL